MSTHNPPRADGPRPHLSAGRYLIPQRYVIGWPSGVIKIGMTWSGKRRWGKFISSGGDMLDLAYYEDLGDASRGEAWLEQQVRKEFRRAFRDKKYSIPYLGTTGAGWSECYAVAREHWPRIIEIARS